MTTKNILFLICLVFFAVTGTQGYLVDRQGKELTQQALQIEALQASLQATDDATMRFAIAVGTDIMLIKEAINYLMEEGDTSI